MCVEVALPAAQPSAAAKPKLPPLVVADMMAGVGPFAVPLAMPPGHGNTTFSMTPGREIVVHANGKHRCTGSHWLH
jgi:hypothetical protein